MSAVGRIIRALSLLWLALAFMPAAQAQSVRQYTNTEDSATDAISDILTPCSGTPYKRYFYVGETFNVQDVNIGVLMAHTYRSDIQMSLVAPDGTRVKFINSIGGSNDNFNVMLDDEGSTDVSNYTGLATVTSSTVVPPYTITYKPSAVLSAFDTKAARGTWTLEICDAVAADTGTFFQADLYITGPTPSYADLSLAKTVSSATPVNGASISYTLSVTNASTSALTATGVTVSDVLPAGVSYLSSSGTGTYVSSTGIWTVGSVAPGATASITISVTVTATQGATVTNTAEITASSVADLDSLPNNGVTSEDDYASRSFTVGGSRTAGTPPILSCSLGTTQLDWDTQAWTAGSLSNSLAVTNIGSTVVALTNTGAWVNNGTYGGLSPTRQKVATGGTSPAQFSLMQLVNMVTIADTTTTTITLPTAVPGAQFTLFDVDYTAAQFADKVTVSGTFNGASVTPTLTNGVSNYVIGTSAYGDVAASDTTANGNVTVTFASAVDKIIITFGNHSLAPANPTNQQAIMLHDITFCKPQTTLSVAKTSSIVSDPFNGTENGSGNAKQIPGAIVRYCILISNAGSATVTSVVAGDAISNKATYLAGTMKSGTACATAATDEDDNNTGSDETDPVGASITGTTITATATSIAPSGTMALVFNATIN